jgi:outer membrane lipoprotein carrier protein
MRQVLCVAAGLFAMLAPPAAGQELNAILRRVEQRYNRAKTLDLSFEQRQSAQGRRIVESGRVVLRKPGRMRWSYTQPAGKLFVCDGSWVYFYSPLSGTAEKARLKETEDFRAPLAFLLGRLDFARDFGRFEWRPDERPPVVRAFPKSDRAPFRHVEFTVSDEGAITRLVVAGVDGAVTEFRFTGERLNVAVDEGAFRFEAPPGVAVMEVEEP